MGSSRVSLVSLAAVLAIAPSLAAAQKGAPAADRPPDRPATPTLVGWTEHGRVEPTAGLIDVAIAADGAGLLAYVIADAATHAEVHLWDTAAQQDLRSFDVSAYTTAPQRLWFVGKGKDASILVVGPALPAADGTPATAVTGWLFPAKAGKTPRKFGPAEVIVLAERKGKPFVATRKRAETKKGTVYTFERFDPKKGKRLGKAATLTLAGGKDAKRGFTFHHWTADGLVAVGTKEGEWSKKEDMRMPDAEGAIDFRDAKPAVAATPIADPMAQAARWKTLAKEGGRTAFARVADDLEGVEVWRDDQPTTVALDQPWELYDPKTLTWGLDDAGQVLIGLSIDPWNRPAVTRKKADPEYFDVFRVDGAKATRIGRMLAPKARFTIGATAGLVWTLERNVGFDRGGKVLSLLAPDAATP